MNDEGFRDALRAAGSVPAPDGLRVDPAAARRAGDLRAKTRTAVTTSLAFSLVILAGLGSVFFAAHRSRPTTLGSEGLPATAVSVPVSPSAFSTSGVPSLVARFERPTVEVGQEETLLIAGRLAGEQNDIAISWGDGQQTAESGALGSTGLPCPAGQPQTVSAASTHTYSRAGTFPVVARVTATCNSSAAASFYVTVVPVGDPTTTEFPRSAPVVTAYLTATATATATAPSGAPSPSSTPTPTATSTPTSTPTARVSPKPSRPATPTPSSSVTATIRSTGPTGPVGTPSPSAPNPTLTSNSG